MFPLNLPREKENEPKQYGVLLNRSKLPHLRHGKLRNSQNESRRGLFSFRKEAASVPSRIFGKTRGCSVVCFKQLIPFAPPQGAARGPHARKKSRRSSGGSGGPRTRKDRKWPGGNARQQAGYAPPMSLISRPRTGPPGPRGGDLERRAPLPEWQGANRRTFTRLPTLRT